MKLHKEFLLTKKFRQSNSMVNKESSVILYLAFLTLDTASLLKVCTQLHALC